MVRRKLRGWTISVAQLVRETIGHTIEPACERRRGVDSAGGASKREKGGLEDVVSIGVVVQAAAADAIHQSAMAADQEFKRRLVALRVEATQQQRIAWPAGFQGRSLREPKNRTRMQHRRHESPSSRNLYLHCVAKAPDSSIDLLLARRLG